MYIHTKRGNFTLKDEFKRNYYFLINFSKL